MQFKQKFLDPFPAISANQFILTAILKAALEAHQAMWAKTRDDIDKIAHATMDAFDNKCCDKNTWNVTFTVLSSIGATAAAVLTVATGGVAALLTLQVIGAAAQVGAVLPPDNVPDSPKGGGETAFLDERSKIEAGGKSSDGRISFTCVGMQEISVEIAPGTVRELAEEQFTARAEEAVTVLIQEYLAKVSELRKRFYG
jgi:hypothetical protein